MPKRDAGKPAHSAALSAFGRYAGPAMLILSSLAHGPKTGTR